MQLLLRGQPVQRPKLGHPTESQGNVESRHDACLRMFSRLLHNGSFMFEAGKMHLLHFGRRHDETLVFAY